MKTGKLSAGAISLMLCLSLTNSNAWGSVTLVECHPEHGEVVAHAPQEINLRFSGNIDPRRTRLFFSNLNGRGALALPRQPKISTPTDRLIVVLPPLSGRGTYSLRFQVVGTDGQPAYGTVTFTSGGY